jgi:hypothetical protein
MFGEERDTAGVGAAGGSAGILGRISFDYLGERWFLRPQVRPYGYVGPAFTLLPALVVGYRF